MADMIANQDEMKRVLEDYYREHAADSVKFRREALKLTMDEAIAWVHSKVGASRGSANCVMVSPEFVFGEILRYFEFCTKGEKFKTEDEVKKMEKSVEKRTDVRNSRAKKLWEVHARRLVRWADLSPAERIRDAKFRDEHPNIGEDESIADYETRMEAERLVREEEARKREEKRRREEAARAEKVRRQKLALEMAARQMDFGF